MGTINLFEEESIFNSKKGHYEIKLKTNGLFTRKTFVNKLKFKRANKPFKCRICEKEKPKNTRYIGGYYEYEKICYNCYIEWFNNSIKELEKLKEIITKNKNDMELNKNRWEREMIVGAL